MPKDPPHDKHHTAAKTAGMPTMPEVIEGFIDDCHTQMTARRSPTGDTPVVISLDTADTLVRYLRNVGFRRGDRVKTIRGNTSHLVTGNN